MSYATREGWLVKRGHLFRTWQRRWFVLEGSTLAYFGSPSDRAPKGVVSLVGASLESDAVAADIDDDEDDGPGQPALGGKARFSLGGGSRKPAGCAFTLVERPMAAQLAEWGGRDDGGKTAAAGPTKAFVIEAASARERAGWLDALANNIAVSSVDLAAPGAPPAVPLSALRDAGAEGPSRAARVAAAATAAASRRALPVLPLVGASGAAPAAAAAGIGSGAQPLPATVAAPPLPPHLSIFTATWNMAEISLPPGALMQLLPPDCDVYALGLQECMHTDAVLGALRAHLRRRRDGGGGGGEGGEGEAVYHEVTHRVGSTIRRLGFHGHIAVAVYVRGWAVSCGLVRLPRATRGAVALGKNLVVTRVANKGAVAIALPLRLPDGDGALTVPSALVFVSCHLTSDASGKSKLAVRNRNASAMLSQLGLTLSGAAVARAGAQARAEAAAAATAGAEGATGVDAGAAAGAGGAASAQPSAAGQEDAGSGGALAAGSGSGSGSRRGQQLLPRFASASSLLSSASSTISAASTGAAAAADGTGGGGGGSGGGGDNGGGEDEGALDANDALVYRDDDDEDREEKGGDTAAAEAGDDADAAGFIGTDAAMVAGQALAPSSVALSREHSDRQVLLSQGSPPPPRGGGDDDEDDDDDFFGDGLDDDGRSPQQRPQSLGGTWGTHSSSDALGAGGGGLAPDAAAAQEYNASASVDSVPPHLRSASLAAPGPSSPQLSSPAAAQPLTSEVGSAARSTSAAGSGSGVAAAAAAAAANPLGISPGRSYVFIIGDLNYRVQLPPDEALAAIAAAAAASSHPSGKLAPSVAALRAPAHELPGEAPWRGLLAHEQLRSVLQEGRVFGGFSEPPIAFPPSYRRKKSAAPLLVRARGDLASMDALRAGYSTVVSKQAGDGGGSSGVGRRLGGEGGSEPLVAATASVAGADGGSAPLVAAAAAAPQTRPGQLRTPSYTDRILLRSPLLTGVSVSSRDFQQARARRRTRRLGAAAAGATATLEGAGPPEVASDAVDGAGAAAAALSFVPFPALRCVQYDEVEGVVGSDHIPIVATFQLPLHSQHAPLLQPAPSPSSSSPRAAVFPLAIPGPLRALAAQRHSGGDSQPQPAPSARLSLSRRPSSKRLPAPGLSGGGGGREGGDDTDPAGVASSSPLEPGAQAVEASGRPLGRPAAAGSSGGPNPVPAQQGVLLLGAAAASPGGAPPAATALPLLLPASRALPAVAAPPAAGGAPADDTPATRLAAKARLAPAPPPNYRVVALQPSDDPRFMSDPHPAARARAVASALHGSLAAHLRHALHAARSEGDIQAQLGVPPMCLPWVAEPEAAAALAVPETPPEALEPTRRTWSALYRLAQPPPALDVLLLPARPLHEAAPLPLSGASAPAARTERRAPPPVAPPRVAAPAAAVAAAGSLRLGTPPAATPVSEADTATIDAASRIRGVREAWQKRASSRFSA